ncbi:uncharacterized protein IL334_003594 [Kwoniella shivajii]|uniref:EGF-like domain-containing protein n=1 Tax=Kwoniella shivajii TaxID=564305 RepID=A0ABZ1CZP6_9TREE|nr:hypothetical protein IL334_003594 [Kwoniella shivajii]
MTILFSSTIAFVLSSTVSWASQVCSIDTCLKGESSSPLLAFDHSNSKYLLPGTYTSSNLTPSSSLLNITHASDTSVISLPSSPIGFTNVHYDGPETIWDNGSWSTDHWKSVYLPSSWYGILENGIVIWGAVPDKNQLPNELIGLNLMKAASSSCNPTCSSHGTCISSNLTTEVTCQCSVGWTGTSCDQCAEGYWGSSCSPGPSNCTIWDDGLSGTGACLGTSTSSLSSCSCAHGTCTSSSECVCSAGWKNNSTQSSVLCDICVEGFFEDSEENCLACPLGCGSCTLQSGTNSTATCTSCSANLSLSDTSPATCIATKGSCVDGTFYDESSSSCMSCSPACSTCTGPSTSECLSCATPRVNLQGSCVYYDASTGVCDTLLSALTGVYVVNLEKSECDACPLGCLECHIPSFSNVKGYNTSQCSSCQEGYLLEDGQCIKKCNTGWYLPEGSAGKNGTCERCDSTCSTCLSASTTCTSCPSPLFAFGGTCISTCPDSTTPLNGTCVPCPPDCQFCSSPTACTVCPTSRPVLKDGRCIEYCPKDEYFDSSVKRCQACDWRCSSCANKDPEGCTSCQDGYILREGQCTSSVDSCGKGGFANGYGNCLSDFIKKTNHKKYYSLFAVIVLILGGGGIGFWLYVRRERKKTRQATRDFGDKLDDHTVQERLRTLRLERVLGLERVHTYSPNAAPASSRTQSGLGDGYEEKRSKRFKELLLPSRRKKRDDSEMEMEMKSTNFAPDFDKMSYRSSQPPPPYIPSEFEHTSSGDLKNAPSYSSSDSRSHPGSVSNPDRRDSLDSIPTPTLPSFVYSSKTSLKPVTKPNDTRSGTKVLSMSSPISPQTQMTSLMPPPRPGMIRTNTQDKEKEVDRRGDDHGDWEMERRLRELWPNLDKENEKEKRKAQGWI